MLLKTAGVKKAWDDCKIKFGVNVDKISRIAHELTLEKSDYFIENSRHFGRMVTKAKAKYPELPIESLHGKWELKLPPISYHLITDDLSNFDKQQIRHTVASLFIEVLIDNEEISLKHIRTGRGKFTKNRTIVDLGGVLDTKDLLHGVCDSPGEMIQTHIGYERLSKDLKDLQRDIGSQEFTMSDWYSKELVRHFYQFTAEYNTESKSEKMVKRHFRYNNDNIAALEELASKDKFYLPVFFDERGRIYYYFSKVFGARPGGKLFETQMIDKAVPTVITDSGANHIKHIIYTVLHGKVNIEHALKHFSDKDLKVAQDADPFTIEVPSVSYKGNENLYRKLEDEFGEMLLLRRCAHALEQYEAGEPSHYIFGKDLTNSGLIMFGNSFKSEPMMRGGNTFGMKKVADSHEAFGVAHQISHLMRMHIKDIHTPLIHGASVSTILHKILEHIEDPEGFDEDTVEAHNIDVYGPEVKNIHTIAEWGECMVNNHVNMLKFTTDDGFPVCHKAVMERTPFKVYAASTRNNEVPYKEYSLVTTMPVVFDNKGQCVFGRENTTPLSDKGVNVKTRGLFANITHSIDAMLLRRIIRLNLEAGECILMKHDDYMVNPNMFDAVIEECQQFFSYLQQNNLYQDAIDQIAAKHNTVAPKLLVGNALDKTSTSFNFLMA